MSNLTVYNEQPLTAADIKGQVNLIQTVMKEIMKDGEHFGVIPGCGTKPALLKAGAEKLAFTFRLATSVEVKTVEMPREHREYRVKVSVSTSQGVHLGEGVGSCSTMESKYRFRTGPTEVTDRAVPRDYWNVRKSDPGKAQEMLGGKGFTTKKGDDGLWYIAVQGEKVEHDNPADFYNTCLKMAKKRALVDAVLTTTAASDIFTQDIEEDPELYGGKPTQNKPEKREDASQRDNSQRQGVEATGGEKTVTDGQVKLLRVNIKKAGITEDDFKQHYSIEHITDIAMSCMNTVLKDLEDKVIKPIEPDLPSFCTDCRTDPCTCDGKERE